MERTFPSGKDALNNGSLSICESRVLEGLHESNPQNAWRTYECHRRPPLETHIMHPAAPRHSPMIGPGVVPVGLTPRDPRAPGNLEGAEAADVCFGSEGGAPFAVNPDAGPHQRTQVCAPH
jgi:hypothetical protein